ncbi:hypothetical protein F4801DRAFT_582113 [Xylaria longipes]|nr:hypothetical protein F4801DRAFT_582113 [Xylaria longipes]
MSTQTFHSFCRLPKELRDQIWEDCVHDFESSAQFFTFYSYEHREDQLEELSGQTVASVTPFYATIAAPRGRETGEISWSRNNKSAYLIDHGLWTACWESREVIQKQYKLQGRVWGTPFSSNYYFRAPATTLAGSFQENGNLRCFVFNPTTDLICLQPYKYRTTEWGLVKETVLFASPFSDFGEGAFAGPAPPFGTYQHNWGPCSEFGVKHVGLELDPNWITHFDENKSYGYDFDPKYGPEGLQCAAQAATDRLHWLNRLWLIDYRIRLQPGVVYVERERFVFTGFGCKFIEVKDGDDTWKMEDGCDPKKSCQQTEDEDKADEKIKAELKSPSLRETLEFVKKLYHSVDKYLEERFESGWLIHTFQLNLDRRSYRGRAPPVGLLACVPDN